MQEVQTTLPSGSIVRNRYKIESLLGKGGFGAVYLVHDTRAKGNQFALKEVIDPRKQDRVHFLFEGEVLKRLDHIALPRVYRVFEDEPHFRVYLLMDYIKGPNLDRVRRLQPENRFALPDMLRLMTPVVEAVMYLQSQQPPIIHRDIKPANIIVPTNGDGPVLVDFGIAKEYDQDATTTAVRKLSPNYSAPEQYSQGTNLSTDVYGMAATFYALLTGIAPIDALERITQKGNHGIDPLEPVNHFVPDIPLSVTQAISRAMALASDDRFPTMEAFWDALQPQSFAITSPALAAPLPAGRSSASAQPVVLLASAMTSPNTDQQGQKLRPVKRRMLLPLFTFLILVAMLLGALFGTSFFSKSHSLRSSASAGTTTTRSHISSTPTIVPTTSSSASATRTSAATATVPATPSPAAKQKPTPAPSYPNLDNQYTGSIHNTPGNIDGTMTLSNVHQNGTTIGGTLILTNGLSGTATFTNGTVANNNTLQFEVIPYTQYPPLLFQGRVNADGSLTGTYCSVQNNQCDYAAGGYGTWRVSPPSPSSQIPSSADDRRV